MTITQDGKSAPADKAPDKTEVLSPLVGTCGYFKVTTVIKGGAFLYCGYPKDVFVPVGEQIRVMKEGQSYIIYVYRDEKTGRVAGSSRLMKYLFDDAPEGAKEGDAVELLIFSQTDLGFKAIVNNSTWGLLYKNEIFQELQIGQKVGGYIKKLRPDGLLDLSLQKAGVLISADLPEKILIHLRKSGGKAPLTDKTDPKEIHRLFGVSKKKFKTALGNLYKLRRISIRPDGLDLIDIPESETP